MVHASLSYHHPHRQNQETPSWLSSLLEHYLHLQYDHEQTQVKPTLLSFGMEISSRYLKHILSKYHQHLELVNHLKFLFLLIHHQFLFQNIKQNQFLSQQIQLQLPPFLNCYYQKKYQIKWTCYHLKFSLLSQQILFWFQQQDHTRRFR